jgi:hypothetical protein
MIEKRQPLQQMLLGKVVICQQKTEIRDSKMAARGRKQKVSLL